MRMSKFLLACFVAGATFFATCDALTLDESSSEDTRVPTNFDSTSDKEDRDDSNDKLRNSRFEPQDPEFIGEQSDTLSEGIQDTKNAQPVEKDIAKRCIDRITKRRIKCPILRKIRNLRRRSRFNSNCDFLCRRKINKKILPYPYTGTLIRNDRSNENLDDQKAHLKKPSRNDVRTLLQNLSESKLSRDTASYRQGTDEGNIFDQHKPTVNEDEVTVVVGRNIIKGRGRKKFICQCHKKNCREKHCESFKPSARSYVSPRPDSIGPEILNTDTMNNNENIYHLGPIYDPIYYIQNIQRQNELLGRSSLGDNIYLPLYFPQDPSTISTGEPVLGAEAHDYEQYVDDYIGEDYDGITEPSWHKPLEPSVDHSLRTLNEDDDDEKHHPLKSEVHDSSEAVQYRPRESIGQAKELSKNSMHQAKSPRLGSGMVRENQSEEILGSANSSGTESVNVLTGALTDTSNNAVNRKSEGILGSVNTNVTASRSISTKTINNGSEEILRPANIGKQEKKYWAEEVITSSEEREIEVKDQITSLEDSSRRTSPRKTIAEVSPVNLPSVTVTERVLEPSDKTINIKKEPISEVSPATRNYKTGAAKSAKSSARSRPMTAKSSNESSLEVYNPRVPTSESEKHQVDSNSKDMTANSSNKSSLEIRNPKASSASASSEFDEHQVDTHSKEKVFESGEWFDKTAQFGEESHNRFLGAALKESSEEEIVVMEPTNETRNSEINPVSKVKPAIRKHETGAAKAVTSPSKSRPLTEKTLIESLLETSNPKIISSESSKHQVDSNSKEIDEKAPTKYYSPQDRLLEYKKNHQNEYSSSVEKYDHTASRDLAQGKTVVNFDSKSSPGLKIPLRTQPRELQADEEDKMFVGMAEGSGMLGEEDENKKPTEKFHYLQYYEGSGDIYGDHNSISDAGSPTKNGEILHVAETTVAENENIDDQYKGAAFTELSEKSKGTDNKTDKIIGKPLDVRRNDQNSKEKNHMVSSSKEMYSVTERTPDARSSQYANGIKRNDPPIGKARNDGSDPLPQEIYYIPESWELGDKNTQLGAANFNNHDDPFYLGKLLPQRRNNPRNADNSNLMYIGDGVKLPLKTIKLSDGSYSLALSDSICEHFSKMNCPCSIQHNHPGVKKRQNDQDRSMKDDDDEDRNFQDYPSRMSSKTTGGRNMKASAVNSRRQIPENSLKESRDGKIDEKKEDGQYKDYVQTLLDVNDIPEKHRAGFVANALDRVVNDKDAFSMKEKFEDKKYSLAQKDLTAGKGQKDKNKENVENRRYVGYNTSRRFEVLKAILSWIKDLIFTAANKNS